MCVLCFNHLSVAVKQARSLHLLVLDFRGLLLLGFVFLLLHVSVYVGFLVDA